MAQYDLYTGNQRIWNGDPGTGSLQVTMNGNVVYSVGTAPPVPTPVPPVVSSGLAKPTTQAELQSILQAAADGCYVALLDPRTDITYDATVTVNATGAATSGFPWGVRGNGAKLRWKGGDADMLVYKGVKGPARFLLIEGLGLYGGGNEGARARSGLRLTAPAGDAGPLRNFTLRDIYATWAQYGVIMEGGVYESAAYNVHVENNSMDGILIQDLPSAVDSNITLIGPNISRNFGAGLRTANSVDVYGFSAIENGAGGIVAPMGIRNVFGGNGENTGEAVIVLGGDGYGSRIVGVEASSDGSTVCRKYVNGQWVDVGKPLLYAIDMKNAPGAKQSDNKVSYYGAAQPNPMKVLKP